MSSATVNTLKTTDGSVEISVKDIANKNNPGIATAWVHFNGSQYDSGTGECQILTSYNISKVVRTDLGVYEAYFEEEMTSDYVVTGSTRNTNIISGVYIVDFYYDLNSVKNEKIQMRCYGVNGSFDGSAPQEGQDVMIAVFGGKQ